MGFKFMNNGIKNQSGKIVVILVYECTLLKFFFLEDLKKEDFLQKFSSIYSKSDGKQPLT